MYTACTYTDLHVGKASIHSKLRFKNIELIFPDKCTVLFQYAKYVCVRERDREREILTKGFVLSFIEQHRKQHIGEGMKDTVLKYTKD